MKLTFGGREITTKGNELKAGSKFPEFVLTDLELNDVTDKEIRLPAVILTFPSVDTSTCSLELLTFNDRLENYKDFSVYGVSKDLPFAMARWVKANAGDYITMLSDHKTGDFGIATGTYINGLSLLARAAFVLDKDGNVTYSEYVPEVGNEPDYDRILEEAQKTV